MDAAVDSDDTPDRTAAPGGQPLRDDPLRDDPLRDGHLHVEGCLNFRDAGGWAARDGRMRTGLLWRSDDPIRLTPTGRAAVEALGLQAVIDLRQHAQFERRPGFVDPDRTFHRPLVDRVIDVDDPPPLSEPAHVADMYEQMVAKSTPQIAEVLDLVAEHVAEGPVLVHCAFGKDRTGVVVALVQVALGVDPADIVRDYGRSHEPTLRRHRWLLAEPLHDDPPIHLVPPYLFTAEEGAMAVLLDRMSTRHGSLEAWLDSFPTAPGTVDALRRALVTPG